MKMILLPLVAAGTLLMPATSRTAIVAGPISNPANGHDYYLLTPNSWTASEAEAECLGGTLAIIRNSGEQKWVFSTFGTWGGTNRHLWIGLHRQWPGGPFAWILPEVKLDYTYWCPGEPDNGNGVECHVHMCAPNGVFGQPLQGGWNDLADNGSVNWQVPCGVVEVPGKSAARALTGKEKSLIGTWYQSGSVDHPCYIAATKNSLFAINRGRAGRLVWTADQRLFLAGWNSHGDLVKDHLLWSDGTWWSRKPLPYDVAEPPTETERKAIPFQVVPD